MHGPKGGAAEVLWSREGDAWIGVLGDCNDVSPGTWPTRRQGSEVELLLRATDWHVEMSHAARGAFEREYIQASNAEEAKSKAANLLLAFRAKIEEAAAA